MTNKPLQMTTEDKLVRVYIFASHMENIFKIKFFSGTLDCMFFRVV